MQKEVKIPIEDRKATDKPTSYQGFIKHSRISKIVKSILNNTLYYSYDNTIFNLILPEKENFLYKNSDIVESFNKAMTQLNINKSLNNPSLDSYLYRLLVYGKLNLKLDGEYKISDKNYDVSISLSDNYIKTLYNHYIVEDNAISKSILITNEEVIIKDLRIAIANLIKKATIINLNNKHSKLKGFIFKIFKITPKFNIILNDEETLLNEYNNFGLVRDSKFIEDVKNSYKVKSDSK